MTGFAKGMIITALVLVVVIGGGILAGAIWLYGHSGEFLEKGKQSMAEGAAFGRKTDNQGCLTETLTRYKGSPGLSSAISTQLFLRACLDKSKPTAGFCDDVPRATEFMKSGQWQIQQCSRVGLARDSFCPQVFTGMQDFCERNKAKPANENRNSSN